VSENRKSAAAYLSAGALCLLGMTWVLKLWRADPSVPLVYGGDALLTQLWVKGLVENGWYLTNGSVGAPFGLEMHDFPLSDGLFFVTLKILSWFVPGYVRVLNVYFLLTFPLAAVSALFVFRRFGVPRPAAVVGGVLFALLPYHFLRGQEHLFLASYFLVPLAVMLVLRVYLDEGPVFRPVPDLRAWGGLAVCVLVGSGGVYYAFFTCYLLLVAGATAAWWRGSLRPLRDGCAAAAVVTATVLVNVSPAFVYAAEHGGNPGAVVRDPAHAEVYGLKVVQLLLPVSGHRVPALARLKARYDSALAPLVHENTSSALGAVGALGFLALTAGLFRRRGPRASDAPGVWDGLVDLNLAAVLLATFGGFGALLGFVATSWIRGYCRMSIFVAFFSLFAAVLGLARLDSPRLPRWFKAAGLGALLLGGVYDQTSRSFAPKYAETRRAFAGDAEFVRRVGASLPPRAMVFQLPYSPYPEPTTVHRMSWYDPLRGYLHSNGLRWSYGAMRGRYADAWQSRVAAEPPDEMARRLALAGFGGVYLDRAGYADAGAALEAGLARRLGVRPLVSGDGRFSFFGLGGYTRALRGEYPPAAWAALCEASLHPVLETWGPGFYGAEEGEYGPFRWSDGRAEITLTNPAPGPRRVELAMTLSAVTPEPSYVRWKEPGGRTEFRVEGRGRSVRRSLIVPPGTSRIVLTGGGPPVRPPGDTRSLAFRVEGFTIADPAALAAAAEAGSVRR